MVDPVGKKPIKNLLEISKWIQGPSNQAQIKVYRLGLAQFHCGHPNIDVDHPNSPLSTFSKKNMFFQRDQLGIG